MVVRTGTLLKVLGCGVTKIICCQMLTLSERTKRQKHTSTIVICDQYVLLLFLSSHESEEQSKLLEKNMNLLIRG